MAAFRCPSPRSSSQLCAVALLQRKVGGATAKGLHSYRRQRPGRLHPGELALKSIALRGEILVNLFPGLVLGYAVTLLDFANEKLTAPLDGSKVIVGEQTLLRLDLAFELLPASYNAVPVHDFLHRLVGPKSSRV